MLCWLTGQRLGTQSPPLPSSLGTGLPDPGPEMRGSHGPFKQKRQLCCGISRGSWLIFLLLFKICMF